MEITINNIRNFVQGYYNYFRNYLDDTNIQTHIREQALYRAMQCVDCLNNGKCLVCKCSTPAMFFAPLKEDSEGRWGKMLSQKEWEEFKTQNNIQLIENFEEIMYDEIIKRYNFQVLRPEWFVYRGGNCFNKMSPPFLMVLDELFHRVFDDTLSKNIIVASYQEGLLDKKDEVVIDANLLKNMEQIYVLVKEAMDMHLSIVLGKKLIRIVYSTNPFIGVDTTHDTKITSTESRYKP